MNSVVPSLGRARDVFGAEVRAGAGAILHHDLLAERLAHARADHARCDVGDGAGTEPDHDADRAIVLGEGAARNESQTQRRRRKFLG